jgi:aminoglycoside phosphotransferase (APT) family kinase protein
MPVPHQRDAATSRERLSAWLAARLPEAGAVTVTIGDVPPARGFSTETLLFTADWRDGGGTMRREPLVARIASTRYTLYPQDRLAEQFHVMRILGERTSVPVPRARWYEPDPAVLGGPFLVMSHVEGRVPADFPSYHRQGWVTELPASGQAGLWWAGVDALHRIHQLDPAALGLGFLDRPGDGSDGVAQQLSYYERHLSHFGCAGDPVAAAALAWLRAHQPVPTGPPVLLWGDARIGNLIYDDHGDVAAVLDWEMAAIGPPGIDLAWYLYLDRHLSEGIGATRLPGLPGPAETIERYHAGTGRPPEHLDYYEVLAGFRLMLITARLTDLMIAHGMVPAGQDLPLARNTRNLLHATLRARGAQHEIVGTRPVHRG